MSAITLDKIRNVVRQGSPNAEVWLFGSRARGDHRPDSDWDIVALSESEAATMELEDRLRDGLYDLELEGGQPISLFIYPKALWNGRMAMSPLRENVLGEGIRL
jgi:uncharacterized protein